MPTPEQKEQLNALTASFTSYRFPEVVEAWRQIQQYLELDEAPLPAYHDSHLEHFIYHLAGLMSHPAQWNDFDHKVLALLEQIWKSNSGAGWHNPKIVLITAWARQIWEQYPDQESFEAVLKVLTKYGLRKQDIWESLQDDFVLENKQHRPTPLGQYLLEFLNRAVANNHQPSMPRGMEKFNLFALLLHHAPNLLKLYLNYFLNDYNYAMHRCRAMLEHDAKTWAPVVLDSIAKGHIYAHLHFHLAHLVYEYAPEQHKTDYKKAVYQYLEFIRRHQFPDKSMYYDKSPEGELMIHKVFNFLLENESRDKAWSVIENFLRDCPRVEKATIEFLYKQFEHQSFPLLLHILNKPCRNNSGHQALFEFLKTIDHREIYPQLLEQLRNPQKSVRLLVARHLHDLLGEAVQPDAEALLKDKKAEARMSGAILLGLVKSESALQKLREALDNEKNDEVRDAMLEGLEQEPAGDRAAIAAMVAQAQKRGKLDKDYLPWLNGQTLPPLYWQDSGEPLDTGAVQFLLYRMSRCTDMHPDVEARPILQLLDRDRSAPFAKVLLKSYLDSGGASKNKWCLTLGAILGGNDEVEMLRRKVPEFAKGNHRFLAENIVKALAMNGSKKALRWIEVFSRKFQSKGKNIGEAAGEALRMAAEERGITLFELMDETIPDFGFSGLFYEFEAGGEQYRAFIDTNFQLVFLNESNRLLKSPPKATADELKKEFKEIAKEIRDIVKSQSDRMEQYLVIQRKWPAERWQAFFMGNPVMFTYAVRLVWGIYDENNRLQQTFICQEDQSLLNREGDEMALPETGQIGMAHPLEMAQEDMKYWQNYLLELGISPVFPQLERPVFPLAGEMRHKTLVQDFNGIRLSDYAFVGHMNRKGWFRGSVVDGGGVSSYRKDFKYAGITAILMQQGELGVAWMGGTAEVGDLMFVKSGSVRFGSYVYDEPRDATDPRLIPLGDLPPVVYSEVMAEMEFFKQHQTEHASH